MIEEAARCFFVEFMPVLSMPKHGMGIRLFFTEVCERAEEG
jgi:hypothetical protein|tara:strand:+ start:1437 stop:1559 length:123 start_codon:yes stop_codon:yes gene_type:complete